MTTSTTTSPLLARHGAVEGEGPDAGVAAHYGDPAREQRLLAEGLAAVDLSHRGVVTVTGPDRLTWLHSMTTQHLLGPLAELAGDGTVECNVRGYHHLAGEVWMVAGWYVLRVADGRLAGITLTGTYETGSRELLARARERAKAGGERVKNAAMATFEASRPAVGAMAVGTARAAYEVALDYAKTRSQFGRPIIDNQGIAFQLADMRTRIDAARLLVWRASWMATTGKPFTSAEGSMSKLYASFIRNSRPRITPKRGRISSRNFHWMWYSVRGRSR